MSTIAVDPKALQRLREQQGYDTDAALAEALGLHKGTISRVLNGKTDPGPAFISSVLLTFPVKFEDVFFLIADTTDRKATAHGD